MNTATATATASHTNTPAYSQLVERFQRLHHLEHLQSIAYWDQAAMMPRGSSEARAGALAELATQNAPAAHRPRPARAAGPRPA